MVAQLTTFFIQENTAAELAILFGKNWSKDIVEQAAMAQVELGRPVNKHLLPLQLTLFEPDDVAFDHTKHCQNNLCSVAAILESREVLLSPNFSNSQKRQAVLYVMHYLLQLHIPLNSGLKRDMGGQNIYLKDGNLQPVNFSWAWNHDLYRRLEKRWFTYARELYRQFDEQPVAEWIVSMSIADWAFETHQLAINEVYPAALEGRYSAALVNSGQQLLEIQLMKAAYRTAAVFAEIYGDEIVQNEAEQEI